MPVLEKEKVITQPQQKTRKMLAFEALEELRKNSPFPKDFDYKAEVAQAIDEKYGYFY
ncbi:MAG: hypothetical protein IJ859_11355 [Synergistaceae bacterium]|nr:hypothetical protein [Synergistaceae bacterium]